MSCATDSTICTFIGRQTEAETETGVQ